MSLRAASLVYSGIRSKNGLYFNLRPSNHIGLDFAVVQRMTSRNFASGFSWFVDCFSRDWYVEWWLCYL